MKKDLPTPPNAQFDTITYALKILKSDLRMAESDFSFELAMLDLDRIIEMVESLGWP